jgi:hypothetical protein
VGYGLGNQGIFDGLERCRWGRGKPHPCKDELQEGGKEGGGGGVVAEGLAEVGEAVDVAGTEYKGAA